MRFPIRKVAFFLCFAFSVGAAPRMTGRATNTESSFGQLQHAIDQVTLGRYPIAIGELREFVNRYPDHIYADYAHYWLAYAHFLKKEYSLAEVTTDFLIFRHPESFKFSDAVGLNALSRWHRGARDHSGDEIRKWLVQHPESSLAPIAEATLFAPSK